MRALERWADRVGVLEAQGYQVIADAENLVILHHGTEKTYFSLDEHMVAVLDAFEQKGFKNGFERGAYEEQQQEDVEKPSTSVDLFEEALRQCKERNNRLVEVRHDMSGAMEIMTIKRWRRD